MKGFKELEKQRECELETEVNEYWSKIDILNQTIEKYKTTREELGNYNNLEDVKVGNKLIIPCPANE